MVEDERYASLVARISELEASICRLGLSASTAPSRGAPSSRKLGLEKLDGKNDGSIHLLTDKEDHKAANNAALAGRKDGNDLWTRVGSSGSSLWGEAGDRLVQLGVKEMEKDKAPEKGRAAKERGRAKAAVRSGINLLAMDDSSSSSSDDSSAGAGAGAGAGGRQRRKKGKSKKTRKRSNNENENICLSNVNSNNNNHAVVTTPTTMPPIYPTVSTLPSLF